jgi:hypothetical protein
VFPRKTLRHSGIGSLFTALLSPLSRPLRERGFACRSQTSGRQGDAERIEEHAGRGIIAGYIEQTAIDGDRRAIDDPGEQGQARASARRGFPRALSASFSGGEGGFRSLGDHRALFLGKGGV